MLLALYIFLALVGVGALLYMHEQRTLKRMGPAPEEPPASQPEAEPPAECCGMHITCEKDSLLASVSDEIIYYDDEELDAFRGRQADAYTDPEIEQFRDVLLTLLPTDIAGWGRSLQLRDITLPSAVRDELLLIVAEARSAKQ